MQILKTAALAALVMVPIGAIANPAVVQGDKVTADTIVAQSELIRLTDALDAAVDGKDWSLARSLFDDTVTVDFTSLTGNPPATIPSDGLIAAWSSNLTAEKTSFHLRGNHRVVFEGGDRATVFSHGYAWNRMERGALTENGGDPLWEVWGDYVHTYAKTSAGWKITGMTFNATAERGNSFVRNTPGS